MRKILIPLFIFLGLLSIGFGVWFLYARSSSTTSAFDGQRAYQDVIAQVDFGPRTVGSPAHAEAIAYIQKQLENAHWKVQRQNTSWKGFPIENIIAIRNNQTPQIILGAHYDSRMIADQDPGPGPHAPVPGANDGASGVAVLLELARTLPTDSVPISLVFIDHEDNGGIGGQDWIMGSRAYVASLTFRPRAVVILDMIGDANLNIYIERNSDPALVATIWKQAADLGYQQQFIPTPKYSMEDDHTPFLEAGIPAVDIIDFDYPYWHTTEDTPDKVSVASLQIVGNVMHAWLIAQK